MQTMARHVGERGVDDALLLPEIYRIFGRIAVVARFNLDEDKRIAVPCDDIDFAALRAIAGGHDSISKRADVVDAENLGPAAESKKPMKEKRKRHTGIRRARK